MKAILMNGLTFGCNWCENAMPVVWFEDQFDSAKVLLVVAWTMVLDRA